MTVVHGRGRKILVLRSGTGSDGCRKTGVGLKVRVKDGEMVGGSVRPE